MLEPFYSRGGITIYVGDNREVLPHISPVHAVVTDPPYGLSFMGKGWDHSVPGVEFWQAIMAAMLPGAHLLAFGGTRTYHRMAVAIEDAGYEIRDTLQWLYGSGFPKSHDVSKAIDKMAGAEREVVGHEDIRSRYDGVARNGSTASGLVGVAMGVADKSPVSITAPATPEAEQWQGFGTALKPSYEPVIGCRKPCQIPGDCAIIDGNLSSVAEALCKLTAKNVDESSRPTPHGSSEAKGDSAPTPAQTSTEAGQEATTPTGLVAGTNSEAGISVSTSDAASIALNMISSWRRILADACDLVSKCTTEMVSSLTTDLTTWSYSLSQITPDTMLRAVSHPSGLSAPVSTAGELSSVVAAKLSAILLLSAPAPAIAEKRLTPNHEPIIMARSPFKGTVAQNVLQHGTGAINVDACRIGYGDEQIDTDARQRRNNIGGGGYEPGVSGRTVETDIATYKPNGRWPANVILDEAAADLLDAMSGVSRSSTAGVKPRSGETNIYGGNALLSSKTKHSGTMEYGDTGGASRFFKVVAQDCLSTYNVEEQECAPCGEESTEAGNTSAGKRTASSAVNSHTAGCGSKPTGLFQTDTKSTTSTTTHSITSCPTCNSSPQNGTTTTTSVCEKTTETLTALNTDAANGVTSTSHSPSSSGVSQEPIRGTANHASANTSESGEPQTANTTTPTCANTESAITGSRFFYVAKASRRERNAGLEGMPERTRQGVRPGSPDYSSGKFPDHDHRLAGANHHPTVKPLALMRWLITMVTPPGGIILDPFMGSGSTLVAAAQLGVKAIGIELDPGYAEIAARRVDHALNERAGYLPGMEIVS